MLSSGSQTIDPRLDLPIVIDVSWQLYLSRERVLVGQIRCQAAQLSFGRAA